MKYNRLLKFVKYDIVKFYIVVNIKMPKTRYFLNDANFIHNKYDDILHHKYMYMIIY